MAVINAIVHNDYTREVPPKFEVFSDRLEITSAGGLPEGLSQDEFFEGYSIPRNKELMRVFKDLELVEQLGTGVLRILAHYGPECFVFSENFLRICLPSSNGKSATEQVTEQVSRLLVVLSGEELGTKELLERLQLKHRPTFIYDYLQPALAAGVIEMTQPDSPRSPTQKYRLTRLGVALVVDE